MKKAILLILIFVTHDLIVAHKVEANEWRKTILSVAAIKNIQQLQYRYKQCVANEIKRIMPNNISSYQATAIIIKQCEAILTRVRPIFIHEKVPERLADRYMKKIRTEITRKALQHIMFANVAKKNEASD